ncbi:MAG TPA: hypothetical protein VGQ30_01885 [Gemmatimonadaceae bacterium]|jgi:hypothetical protein|nr:hypothetical protein [Gemmatimonadaceae bacterium]
MPHPDEGLIHAWLDGELDVAEAARIEALVASDPDWAAAAAEARGLLAASSRIVGSLDRVPANVIPKPADAPRQTGGRWLLRAAAILVLIGGSAVVLNRASIDGGDVTVSLKQPADAPAVSPAPAAPAPTIIAKSNTERKELEKQKQQIAPTGKDRDAPAAESRVAAAAQPRADAAAGGAGANTAANLHDLAAARRAAAPAAALPAAPAPLQQGALKKAQAFAEGKTTRLLPVCFSQREPRDSAGHLILLDRDALADSVRLEKLTQHGDTIAAVNGRLRAVRAPCPAP